MAGVEFPRPGFGFMEGFDQTKIRNVAIIAHVDHGKTTLVDGLLKQARVFRENEAEMAQTTILDYNDLERERGITILAKNTSIVYNDFLINIIDTPGHADFSGEVERVLNMADGAILLIDAQEGPMPQTRFVLKKALELNLKVIVFINKIDKKDARVEEVVRLTENLFLELASDNRHLDYSVLYGVSREGKSWESRPSDLSQEADLRPLFHKIIEEIPSPSGETAEPFQMLISALDFDSFHGKYALGRISRGRIRVGEPLMIVRDGEKPVAFTVTKIELSQGLKKIDLSEASVGQVILLAGSSEFNIGDTIADPKRPESLGRLSIGEPTLKVALGANTSPFAGREGEFSTSRQLKERIWKEIETNVGLKVEPSRADNTFLIYGRGELHLSIFIETLRREGYEFQVGKPEVIYKEINGVKSEPYEDLYIDVPELYSGAVNSEIGRRRGLLQSMEVDEKSNAHLVFKISTQGTLGLRNVVLSATKGTAVMNSIFTGFEKTGTPLPRLRNGVLIASEGGKAVTYGLNVAQGRGSTFIDPGTDVYEGMVVGLNCREEDIEINVCKEKKQSNVRSSTSDISVQLAPKVEMSLEQCLNFLEVDEVLEVTPKSLRLRKKLLSKTSRVRAGRSSKS